MQFITSTLLIGKLVCYAVYYKYIIDLLVVSMLCSLLQVHYWFKLVCYGLLQVHYWFNW